MPTTDVIQLKITADAKQLREEKNKIKRDLREIHAGFDGLQVGSKEYGAQMDKLVQKTKQFTQNASFKDLRNEYNRLRKEVEGLVPGTEAYIRKSKQLDIVRTRFKGVGNEIKGVSKSTKNFDGQLKNTIQTSGLLGGRFQGLSTTLSSLGGLFRAGRKDLDSMSEGTEGFSVAQRIANTTSILFSNGLKLVKFALIGLGIGVILVAVGALVSYFTKTKEGSEKLAQAMSYLAAGFAVIIDRTSALGKLLFGKLLPIFKTVKDSLSDVFTNPKQAILDLGTAIKENLINRLKSFGVFTKGIVKILSGDFKEGLKEIGNASIQLTTGVEDGVEKLKDFGKKVKKTGQEIAGVYDGVGEEIKKEAKLAANLTAQKQALADRERAFIKKKANVLVEISKIREKIAAKESITAQESNALSAKAIELTKKLGAEDQAIANQKVGILKQQVEMGESLASELDALAQAEVTAINLQAQYSKSLKKLTAEQQTAIREYNLEKQKELEAIDKVLNKVAEQVTAENTRYENELKNIGALNKAKEQLTAEQLQALEILEQEHQTNLSNFKAERLATEFEQTTTQAAVELELEREKLLNKEISYEEYLANVQALTAEDREQALELEAEYLEELKELKGADDEVYLEALSEYKQRELDLHIAAEESKREEDEKTKAQKDKNLKQGLGAARDGFQAIANLDKAITDVKIKNAEGNEKEQERLRKEAFARQKAYAIADLAIKAALAVVSLTATFPPPTPMFFVGLGLIAASTIASAIQIGNQTYENGGILPEYANGGFIQKGKGGVPTGPRHTDGGLGIYRNGQKIAEMEGGEPILSRNTYKNNKELIDWLLYSGKFNNGAAIFEDGGVFDTPDISAISTPTYVSSSTESQAIDYSALGSAVAEALKQSPIEATVDPDKISEIQERNAMIRGEA